MRMWLPNLFRKSFPRCFLLCAVGSGERRYCRLGGLSLQCPALLGFVLRKAIPGARRKLVQELLLSLDLWTPSGWVCLWKSVSTCSRCHLGSYSAFTSKHYIVRQLFFFSRSEKPGWRSRLSPSQDFPSTPCLQTRPAQYHSIQQAGGMNWERWWSHKHAELHAGTPFREKSEEAEQGGQKWLRALR